MKSQTFKTELGDKEITVEIGKLAPQANGACIVRMGETVVLGTAVMSKEVRPGTNFLPLMVDYEERLYASGKIKGSRFIKREGKPTDEAILTSRLIDRGIRPLFNKYIRNDIQIVVTVLSYDSENDADIPAMLAASVALQISDIPFEGPLSGVRVGKIDGKLVVDPTIAQVEKSTLDLVVSGKDDKILMLEAGAKEIPEAEMLEAVKFAQDNIAKLNKFQEEITRTVAPVKRELVLASDFAELEPKVDEKGKDEFQKIIEETDKTKRSQRMLDLQAKITKELAEEARVELANNKDLDLCERAKKVSELTAAIPELYEKVWGMHLRQHILTTGSRIMGRKLDEIRPLSIEVGLFPRTHGSGFFQRGETQAITMATLGSPSMEQILDGMEVEEKKHYMHHYNFPPFSTGEAKPIRSPGRREIGHGALAERALLPVLPEKEDFPYTIRLVTEILASSGSTSMAATCGSTLALMDAGVPIKKPVAGIAMGLMTDPKDRYGNFKILSDLQDAEDFAGDMDFKITGTADGITAIQMDTKIQGLSLEMVEKTFAQSKIGREYILGAMKKVLAEPRKELSKHAPRLETFKIDVDKIRVVIGKGGEMINKIIDETGVEIDIEDDGTVTISSIEAEQMKKAKDWIKLITTDPKPGDKFKGKVVRLMDFGAFVEVVPGKDGLVHISHLTDKPVQHPSEVVKIGDQLDVVVTEIDEMGRINLSHLLAIGKKPQERPRRPFRSGRPGGGRPRGGRGGFGGRGGSRRPNQRF